MSKIRNDIIRTCKIEIGTIKLSYSDNRPLKSIRKDILKDISELVKFGSQFESFLSDSSDDEDIEDIKDKGFIIKPDLTYIA